MHALKTVRVAHPMAPDTFQIINAKDYREGVHGPLWHEQAPDFSPEDVVQKPEHAARRDPAVRDLAAAVMSDVMDTEARRKGHPLFSTLSPQEQLTALRDVHNELKSSEANYAAHRERQVAAHQAEQDAARATQAEATRIEAERQAREDAAREPKGGGQVLTEAIAAHNAEAAAPDAQTAQQRQVETAPAGTPPAAPAPAPAAPATAPAWAAPTAPAAAEAPDAAALRVEQGPGKKWFVMRGKDVVGAGHAKKADAEAEMAKLEAAK